MAEIIRMPRMSDTMEEGTIVEWHKKVGDQVETGDILAEVETDKATMELESYFDGTLLYVGIKKGDSVPINAVMAIIGDEGEDVEKILAEAKKEKSEKEEVKEEVKEEEVSKVEKSSESGSKKETSEQPAPSGKEDKVDKGRVKASPLAKKMADELGIDISGINGSGDNGRIIKRDVENYKDESPSSGMQLPVVTGEEGYEDKSVSQMRKTIARRLSESKFSAPHFYLTMEINMDRAVEARKSLNENIETKVSFNDFIIKAAAAALRKHPQVNASWLGDKIRFYQHIHIGVAVAMDEGLIVPVLRFADQKGISRISEEVRDLAEKARDKKLQPQDWEGNTFTISNLGMFGIEEFTAIINPPDACILAVGGIKKVPVIKNGELKETNVLKVTLSCDHRVVDGAVGSRFLKTFREYLEEPVRMLL